MCKKSGFVKDKDNFKTAQVFLQTMLPQKTKAFMLRKNYFKTQTLELWKSWSL